MIRNWNAPFAGNEAHLRAAFLNCLHYYGRASELYLDIMLKNRLFNEEARAEIARREGLSS
jgi:hypothetical protein